MEKKELIVGAHFRFSASSDYFVGVIKEMIRVNATGAALFVGPPQSRAIAKVTDENIIEAKKLALENNIDIEKFVVHARYLVNMANPINESNRKFSIELMIQDIKTTERLGIKYINFHPGSALKTDANEAIKILATSINEVIEATKDSDVTLLIETMMTKGSYIGKNFDEIGAIIDLIKDKKRIGVCIDTCHIWDGGYDIKENFDEVLKEFDNTIGLKYLKAFHINDSKNEKGSGKDRHNNLTKGFIGLDFFKQLTTKEEFIGLPFLLETPWIDKTTPSYDEEIAILQKNFKKKLKI